MATAPIPPSKICTKCGEEKPRTREFFHYCNGYPRPRCKPCWREWEREYFWNNRDAKRQAKKRQWANADKVVLRARFLEWKSVNREKVRAADARRLEQIRGDPKRRENETRRIREWARANPEAAAAQRARRRAREYGAPGNYTRQDVHAILRLQCRRCYYCEANLARFDVDHWIPLVRGGSNHPENIVICCDSCNSSKGSKLPWEWQPHRFKEGQPPRP